MKYSRPPPLSLARRRHKKVAKHNELEILKESAKTVGKEYCVESSISGLKHLVRGDTSHFERAIWTIVMISALIFSISLVWMTFKKYYTAPLVTTQMPEGVSVSKIIFPAVGICTNNRISKRAIMELAHKLLNEKRNSMYDEEGMLTMLNGLGLLYSDQIDDQIIKPMELHRILGVYDVNELMRALTPRCEDLLMRCAWNEQAKNCSDLFDFRLTMNGYCCTFNYLRRSDVMFKDPTEQTRSIDMYKYGNKSNFDFDQGLKILMRLDESDDFFYNLPLQGAQLQFSDAYDFPDAPSGSFSMQIISPNVQMTVTVTASFTEASRDIQHVPVKLRQCLFYDESTYLPFYTHSDCMLKCRMSFLLGNCNCTPFNMPKVGNTRTCDMRDVPCLRIYRAQSITVRPNVEQIPYELEMNMVDGGIHCPMCYPTCSKTAYNYEFNNVKIYPEYLNTVSDADRVDWLNLNAISFGLVDKTKVLDRTGLALHSNCKAGDKVTKFRHFRKRAENVGRIVSNFHCIRCRQGANFTGTSIVHVKYGREVAECYGQNVIMKWFDLISNIGSTCGFVTGFSFVSALEFAYFFTVKMWREIKQRKSKNKRVADVNAIYTTNYEPIRRYQSLYWNELTGPRTWNHSVAIKEYYAHK